MKASSSEWYNAKARHVLPVPPSLSTSSSTPSQRLFHGSSNESRHSISSRPFYGTRTPTFNNTSLSSQTSSRIINNTSSQRSLSTLSNSNRSNFSKTPSTSLSLSTSRTSRTSHSRSDTTSVTKTATSSHQYSTDHITSSSTSSFRQPSLSDDTKYKRTGSRLFPALGHPSTSTSSFSSQQQREHRLEQYRDILESEVSESEVAITEEEEEEEQTTDAGSTQQPTDEASSTEEDLDDESVYSSFKDSLRMLRVQGASRRFSKSRSISPAVSLRSVANELEEDEEDLSPEEVDDEATEDDDEEEEESSSSPTLSRSSYRSTSVPKSPVKVRVKVERAVPDYDDRVKVTVQVEEETEVSEEEDEESSEDEPTNNTAKTVRFQQAERTEGESCEEESEEESLTMDSVSGQSESEQFSDDEEDAELLALIDKTDPIRMLSQSPFRNVSSLGDLPPVMMTRGGGLPGRSRTIHEIHESENKASATKKSELCNIPSLGSEGSGTASSGGGQPPMVAPPTASSRSSSRSQSARSSLIGRNAMHKMYSVGGKLRSLSARRSILPTPLRPLPSQIQSMSSESSVSTPSYDNPLKPLESLLPPPSPFITKYSSLAMTSEMNALPSSPRTRSLSARLLSSRQKVRHQDTYTVLRQLSLSDVKHSQEDLLGLPPISPSSPSVSSISSSSLSKPRPLLRNLTYTVCNPLTNGSGSSGADGTSKDVDESQSEVSSGQIRLRQLGTVSSGHTTSGSGRGSLSEIVSSALGARVSFANTVIEHSLSSSSQKTTSVTSEQSGSTLQRPASGVSSESSDDGSEASTDDEAKQKPPKLKMTEEELLNKTFFTLAELEQASMDEPEKKVDNRLKRFALKSVQRKVEWEKQQSSTEAFMDERPVEHVEEEEEESTPESSEGEESDTIQEMRKEMKTQIPIPSMQTSIDGVDGTEPGQRSVLKKVPVRTASQLELEKLLTGRTPSFEVPVSKEVEFDPDLSWTENQQKKLEAEAAEAEEELKTRFHSRVNSAASGYRAMPPSRVGSKDKSRQASEDLDELEKEKDMLIQEWKKAGTAADDNKSKASSRKSSAKLFGGQYAINRLESGSADGDDDDDGDGSMGKMNGKLVKGGIDLTQEIGGEEKKISAVWQEFNRDDDEVAGTADYEFSSMVDEMVTDVNNYKPRATGNVFTNSQPNSQSPSQSHSLNVTNSSSHTSSSSQQENAPTGRKYETMSELISLLSHNLRLVTTETLEDHMASVITLISTALKKVRKNRADDDYTTQIACLSSIRVLCDRLLEMHNSQNLKYADLSWLFRILCKYSSDSDSKIRVEASFCLARLVKVAGPTLVVRPIYFILVMESESGGDGKASTGAKTKAAAIDTLTYALLTFPKEDFHNLEEIAGWVCLTMLNDERRIRQSALECLAVISQHLGGREKCIPLFHTLFLKEEMDHFSRSPSPDSIKTTKTGKSGKSKKSGGSGGAVPHSVSGTVRLLTGPGFPIAQPIDAIISRLEKNVLPVPSTKGLIEYAVNVPTGKDLVLLMTHMLEKDDDEWDFSSSTDSLDSNASIHSKKSDQSSLGMSDIDWTGDGPSKSDKLDDKNLISSDVAYILLGKGRVNKQEVVLLDTYKKEIIPEIIEMLNEKKRQGRGRNRRRGGTKQNKKRRRKKGQQKKGILDSEKDGARNMSLDDVDDILRNDDDVLNNEAPVAVVVDPPPEDTKPSEEKGT